MKKDITGLYCLLDDYAKLYEICEQESLLPYPGKRKREGRMGLGEMLCVMVMYSFGHSKNFKFFYKAEILGLYKDEFPHAVSYNRFVELMPRLLLPLTIL